MRSLAATAVLGLALLTSPTVADPIHAIAQHDKDTPWLFISTSAGLSFDGATASFTEVSPQVTMFTDRPRRVAAVLTVQQLVDAWAKGKDSFRRNPPNAGITVWADGGYQVSVVTLSEPAFDGKQLSFKAKLISGNLPKSGTRASLFIDGGCSPWDPRC
jgi:hypothetical protein